MTASSMLDVSNGHHESQQPHVHEQDEHFQLEPSERQPQQQQQQQEELLSIKKEHRVRERVEKNYRVRHEQWFCAKCAVYCNSEMQYQVHMMSKKHKFSQIQKQDTIEGCEETTNGESDELKKDMNNEIAHQWGINPKEFELPVEKQIGKFAKFGFYCKDCNVYMTGQMQLAMHVRGTRHQTHMLYKNGQIDMNTLMHFNTPKFNFNRDTFYSPQIHMQQQSRTSPLDLNSSLIHVAHRNSSLQFYGTPNQQHMPISYVYPMQQQQQQQPFMSSLDSLETPIKTRPFNHLIPPTPRVTNIRRTGLQMEYCASPPFKLSSLPTLYQQIHTPQATSLTRGNDSHHIHALNYTYNQFGTQNEYHNTQALYSPLDQQVHQQQATPQIYYQLPGSTNTGTLWSSTLSNDFMQQN